MNKKYIYLLGIFLLSIVIGYGIYKVFNKKENPDFDGTINNEFIINKNGNTEEYQENIDSLEFIETITKQKIQEVFDLSTSLYSHNTEPYDSIIQAQISSYFIEEEIENNLSFLENEIKKEKIFYTKLNNLNILEKDSIQSDTIGIANFSMNYYNKEKKFIKKTDKKIQYYLKKNPKKLKKEFKYYIVSISEKDSIE